MNIWSAEIKELEILRESFKGQLPSIEKELDRLIITDDENMALVYARRSLEVIITQLCDSELHRSRGTEPLKGIIDKLNKEEVVPHNIIISMLNLNSLSSFGAHPKDFDPRQVKPVILDLTTVLEWFLKHTRIITSKPTSPSSSRTETPKPEMNEPVRTGKVPRRSKKRTIILLTWTSIILAIGISVVIVIRHQANNREAREIALNEIDQIASKIESLEDTDGIQNWNVYHSTVKLEKILRNDPTFINFWNSFTFPLTINTAPTKAKVYAKPYSRPDTAWYYLGETPLLEFPFPKGLSRIKVEKPGFETQHDILYKPYTQWADSYPLNYKLFVTGDTPENMVYIPGHQGNYQTTPFLKDFYIGDIWMDRYEVSNQQFKAFIDSGGYTNSEYWQFQFIDGDDTLDVETAMNRFKDKTGWLGPTNWEQGEFPKGEEDIPVTGISWYEASAYARFVDKELPTVFHWVYASEPHAAAEIVKFGNFDQKGPAEGGIYKSQTRYGTHDIPGNVSEWIFNSMGSNRIIMGGNFKEPTYWYNNRLGISPWKRNQTIGFRCIRYIDDTLRNELSQVYPSNERDFTNTVPVSDVVFEVIMDLYSYEKVSLNPVIESRVETEHWIQEMVSVNVPYEDAPMKIMVLLPTNTKPPYQSIIYYPGLEARYATSTADMNIEFRNDFLLKGGRAVIWPVYYGTYGRGDYVAGSRQTRIRYFSYLSIDVQIACDYLETRSDMDAKKIAFWGVSWGGYMAPFFLAIEDRIKLGILSLFGVQTSDKHQELDQINYLPRVKIPLLLMAGRHDPDYSLKQQQAFYDFLGTPEKDKEWKIYESTHYIPRKDEINESLNWLDKYFGPVNK